MFNRIKLLAVLLFLFLIGQFNLTAEESLPVSERLQVKDLISLCEIYHSEIYAPAKFKEVNDSYLKLNKLSSTAPTSPQVIEEQVLLKKLSIEAIELSFFSALTEDKKLTEVVYSDADEAFAESLSPETFFKAKDFKAESDLVSTSLLKKWTLIKLEADQEKKDKLIERSITEGAEVLKKWKQARELLLKSKEQALISRNSLIDSLSDLDEGILSLEKRDLEKKDKDYLIEARQRISLGFREISEGQIKSGFITIDSYRSAISSLLLKYSSMNAKSILEKAKKDWDVFTSEVQISSDTKDEYESAKESLQIANDLYAQERWDETSKQVEDFNKFLDTVKEKIRLSEELSTLPETISSKPDKNDKDSISKLPAKVNPVISNKNKAKSAIPKKYKVKSSLRSETLSSISKKFYGKEHKWKKIYKANMKKIKDPDMIFPSQILIIP